MQEIFTEEQTRVLSCPLCQGKNLIHVEDGMYDYSHALVCPQLRNAHNPIELLQYHLGKTVTHFGDIHGFQDYQRALESIGCILDNEVHSEDEVVMSVVDNVNHKKIIVLKCDDASTAYTDLRHRLLCGEVLQTSSGVWRLKKFSGYEPLEFEKVL